MRRLWVIGAAALLTACGAATDTASCAPCPGPGFVAGGLPDSLTDPVIRTCVEGEPCRTDRTSGPFKAGDQQFVPLARSGAWAEYDGTQVTVTVRSHGQRWQGSGAFVFHDGGDSPCSCASLLAQVRFSPVG